MPYSTKQQQAVLRCLESRESEALSAQELAEELRREGFSVGLATIYRQLERLEEAVDKMEAAAGEKGTFLDEIIMHEVLSELRDIAQRGGISCTCGSREWKLQVNFSSVDLICGHCGRALRIPAATADDLEDLCCKNTLLIKGKGE